MAVYKRDIIDINLETGNIYRSWLKHSIGMTDQKADHFGVRVFRNGEAVSLTGVSVQGVFMPPQGSPIAITSGNIVSGNVAEVVLPQACYNYDGQFTLAIKLVDASNSVTGTVRIVDGMVDNTHASGTVAPTSAVPTYQEVLSVYEQAITVIGKSVRFDTDQSLTDAQKTTARGNIDAASTGDVSELKSAIASNCGNTIVNFTAHSYIATNKSAGAEVNLTPVETSDDSCCAVVDCSPGDVFVVKGTGGSTGRLWAFINSSNQLISKASSGATETELHLIAPDNSSKAVFNGVNSGIVVIDGELLKNKVEELGISTEKKLKSIPQIPYEYRNVIDYIDALEIYVPTANITHKLGLKYLGVYASESKFYISVYDYTSGSAVGSVMTSNAYASIPTAGKETLYLSNSAGVVVIVTIDWSKYSSSKYRSNAGIIIQPVGASDVDTPIDLGSFKSGLPSKTVVQLHYIKEFVVAVPYDVMTHEFAIRFLGYLQSANAFYVGLYDKTADESVGLAIQEYPSIPTDGIEELTMKNGGYSYRIVIDWAKYNADYWIQYNSSESADLYLAPQANAQADAQGQRVIYGNNTNLATVDGSAILIGSFYLNGRYDMQENQSLIGAGAVITVGETASIRLNDCCTIDNIRFDGGWDIERTESGSGFTPLITIQQLENESSDAIWGTGKTFTDAFIQVLSQKGYNVTVRNCIFEKFDRCAIRLTGGAHKSNRNGQIVGNYFYDCWVGLSSEGEFTRVATNEFYRNVIGLYNRMGNVSKTGNIFKCCDVGMFYPDSTNNGHGESVGMEFAHCGLASLYIKNIYEQAGDSFSGCNFFEAPIIAEESNSLIISGGIIATYISIASGQHNAIVNNVVGVTYLDSHPLYNVPSDTIIRDNIPLYNATDEEINPT